MSLCLLHWQVGSLPVVPTGTCVLRTHEKMLNVAIIVHTQSLRPV